MVSSLESCNSRIARHAVPGGFVAIALRPAFTSKLLRNGTTAYRTRSTLPRTSLPQGERNSTKQKDRLKAVSLVFVIATLLEIVPLRSQ